MLWTLLTNAACGDRAPAADPPGPESAPATAEPAPSAQADAFEPRCGDLLSPSDLTGIGLNPEGLKPDNRPSSRGHGAHCTAAPTEVTATVFEGSSFSTMMAGYKKNAAASGLVEQEGPSIGGSSVWTRMGPAHNVMFQSSNEQCAANVSGIDKAQVEKLARVLVANMEKR